MTRSLREIRNGLVREIQVYRLVLAHRRTPWVARLLISAAIAYAVSPIDLIPDWFPVVGQLDDIVIVPLLIWLGVRLVPAAVVQECRELAQATGGSEITKG